MRVDGRIERMGEVALARLEGGIGDIGDPGDPGAPGERPGERALDRTDGDGISGRLQWHDTEDGRLIGRFGWKGDAPTIVHQVTAAFADDMGFVAGVPKRGAHFCLGNPPLQGPIASTGRLSGQREWLWWAAGGR